MGLPVFLLAMAAMTPFARSLHSWLIALAGAAIFVEKRAFRWAT